jgi:DNA polymerase
MSQAGGQTGSQMSREDMLRELELLPVWQLRQPLPTPFKTELPAADKSEQAATEKVVQEPAITEQQPSVSELPVIEIVVAESAVLEPSIPESIIQETSIPEPSVPEQATSAPPVLEAPMMEALVPQQLVPQQMEVVESFEIAPSLEQVLEQALPLRLLLSEDSSYAFLIEPYAAESEMQEVETLLRNMIRAMQASCRVDVTDTADKIFAVHTPKLMISLGAAPANRLSGKTYTLDEWRNIQQENPPLYEQIPLIVTYHPVHLLANAADKALAWRDLCAAMKLVQNL